MTALDRITTRPEPESVSLGTLTTGLPAPWIVDRSALVSGVARGRRLVVLDDDPTGTQTVADLPVLTSWAVADLRWALQQETSAFFVLTNDPQPVRCRGGRTQPGGRSGAPGGSGAGRGRVRRGQPWGLDGYGVTTRWRRTC